MFENKLYRYRAEVFPEIEKIINIMFFFPISGQT